MLVVLHGAPVASPFEAMLDEEAVAEVVLRDLILERLTAVDVGLTRGRLDEQRTVFLPTDTGIIQRIDVDGESTGMVRQFRTALHDTIAVTRGVVGAHRGLVVIAIFGDGTHPLNGIFRLVEFCEDLLQVLRYRLVAYKDTHLRLPLSVDMLDMQRIKDHTGRLGLQGGKR